MKAIEVTEYGDSDALEVVDADLPDPNAGEVRIEVEAAVINFADIMQCRGVYPGGPDAPSAPGTEAAGTVDAVGEGVDLVLESVGDDVFERSLDAMAHFGRMVTFGVPAEVENRRLLCENKTVKGYHLGQAFAHDPDRVLQAVPELTEGLTSGDLEVILGESFALEDAAEAHQYIEDRKSSGKVVLKP